MTCLCTSSSTQHAPDGQRHRAQRPPSPTTLTHRTLPFDPEVCSFDPEVCSFDPEDVIHSDYPSTAIAYLHWRACAHNCFPLHTSTHTLPPYARVHARPHVTKQGRSEDDRAHTHTHRCARGELPCVASAKRPAASLRAHAVRIPFDTVSTRTVGPTRASGGPPCRPLRSFPSDPFKFESGGSPRF